MIPLSWRRTGAAAAALLMGLSAPSAGVQAKSRPAAPAYSLILRGGTIYDGNGGKPYVGDVAIKGDRIAAIAPHIAGQGAREIDAHGKAVSPGFINMLAHPEASLMIDGRGLSDLRQGVTLEVMGEDSQGPLTPGMRANIEAREVDVKYKVDWTTLGQYLDGLQRRGVSVNIASYVGGGDVRVNVLGDGDIQPTPAQLVQMQALVHQAMEEGAVGFTTALIYAPFTFAKKDELIALASEAARCGGIYSAHMRSEGARIEDAVQETIDIAKASGGAAEIYHLKMGGRDNWGKLDKVVGMIEAARASGVRITADMYAYTGGRTGLDVNFPPWADAGGIGKLIERLKDPQTRARILVEMRDHNSPWENLGVQAGPGEVLLLKFKNPALKPLTGKTLDEVAAMRHESREEAAMDLVIEDGSRVDAAYILMSEDNVRREMALPWVSYSSDDAAQSNEGVFLQSANHPRAYGNFARVLGKYVREEHVITLPDAIRKLAALPADVLGLKDRGRLKVGNYADVVVFDADTIIDHATYTDPKQYATGVIDVVVNGQLALENGEPTAARPGQVVRGRGWTGYPDGGCRASAKDWTW